MSDLLKNDWNRLAFAKSSSISVLKEVDENAFLEKAAKAKSVGADKFKMGDKEYPVTMDKDSAESIIDEEIPDDDEDLKETVYRSLVAQLVLERMNELEVFEEELPIPGVAYPIEIEELIVDPVLDSILEPQEIQPTGFSELEMVDDELAVIEDLGVLDPAVSIDIAPEAVDPMLDTFEELIFDEEDMYPYDSLEIELEPEGTPKGSEYGRMTKGKLFRMGQMAQDLHDMLEDGQDIPEWTKDKISTAEDRLSSAYNYIEYKIHRLEQKGCLCTESHVRKFAREYLLNN